MSAAAEQSKVAPEVQQEAAAPAPFVFSAKPFVTEYSPYSGAEGSIEGLIKTMCETKK